MIFLHNSTPLKKYKIIKILNKAFYSYYTKNNHFCKVKQLIYKVFFDADFMKNNVP